MNRGLSRRPKLRFAFVSSLICLAFAVLLFQPGDNLKSLAQGPNGTVTHTTSGGSDVWRIDQPNVKQKLTPYTQIRFRPGDRIRIDAGGCVQTGGVGSTWKRYVNPSGPNADRLYHGLIWIPGVIGGPAATGVPPDPKRLIPYLGPNQQVTVPNVDVNQLYLRLGYEDDDYSDNGYYSHDDGTQNQCKNIGNAYIVITITHNLTPPPTAGPAPFDLVWNNEDDNGVPLNPEWGWQITHPGARPDPNQCADGPHKSPCTSWADVINFDTAEICNLEQYEPLKDNSPPLYGIAGHGNWAAGTFVGSIQWETHSTPGTDDDYNFKFFPTCGASLTDTRDNLETEFDSDETIDHFNTPWWNLLHTTVDNHSDGDTNSALFNGTTGRYAIVTGLVGLEFCHSGSSEVHPVWAIAIRVSDSNPGDEVWAMFVRNWGDEGYCSGDQHYLTDLPNNTYVFRLPWRPGASAMSVLPSTVFHSRQGSGSGPGISIAPNQGVLVSFSLPSPPSGGDTGEMIHGELHLQWTGGQGPAPVPVCGPNRVIPGRVATAGTQSVRTTAVTRGPVLDPEEAIGSLLTRMPATQRTQILAQFRKPQATPDSRVMRTGAVSRLQSLPAHPARPRRVQFKSVPDQNKRAKNQRLRDMLRRTLGAVPGR